MKLYLKVARVGAGIPQWLVAKHMGISKATLSNWENGRAEIPPETERLYFQVLKKLKEKTDDLLLVGEGAD